MSRSSARPLHHQIAERLLHSIVRQALPPGTRLPPQLRLAREFNCSSAAVNRAVLELESRGVLRREGYKLFVAGARAAPVRPVLYALGHHQAAIDIGKRFDAQIQLLPLPKVGRPDGLMQALWDLKTQPPGAVILSPPRAHFLADSLAELAGCGMTVVLCGFELRGFHCVGVDARASVALGLQTLLELGHTEFCFITDPNEDAGDDRYLLFYQEQCAALGLRESSARVWVPDSDGTTADFLDRHGRATASICRGPWTALGWTEALDREGVAIPKAHSVLALTRITDEVNAPLPVSFVADDLAAPLGEMAVFVALEDQVRRIMGQRRFPPVITRIDPQFYRRGTTGPCESALRKGLAHPKPNRNREPTSFRAGRWPHEAEDRKQKALRMWSAPYPQVEGLAPGAMEPLNLTGVVNRGVSTFRSWMGEDPLLHFPAGLRMIHGVPFHILDDRRGEQKSAIALRSRHVRHGSGRLLPASVTVPCGMRVRCLFFLHACGWAHESEAFARYEIRFADGEVSTIPLIPLGWPNNPDDRARRLERANIQDWWFELDVLETARARPVPVTEGGEPLRYERYLYTLCWESPRPGVEVESIVCESEEDRPEALIVLAITAVKTDSHSWDAVP